jgi:hypothetical protein
MKTAWNQMNGACLNVQARQAVDKSKPLSLVVRIPGQPKIWILMCIFFLVFVYYCISLLPYEQY